MADAPLTPEELAVLVLESVRGDHGDVAQRLALGWAVHADERKCPGVPDPKCGYLATCGNVCNKCGRVHSPRMFTGDRRIATPSPPVAAPAEPVARVIFTARKAPDVEWLVDSVRRDMLLYAAPQPPRPGTAPLSDERCEVDDPSIKMNHAQSEAHGALALVYVDFGTKWLTITGTCTGFDDVPSVALEREGSERDVAVSFPSRAGWKIVSASTSKYTLTVVLKAPDVHPTTPTPKD